MKMQRRLFAALFVLGLLAPSSWSQAAKLKFEVYQDAAKEYRWRLQGPDGVLATAGQGYKAKADAMKGAERFKGVASNSKLSFEIYEDKSKAFRWRLKSSNGQVVATSPSGYKTKADCEKAIDLIKKQAGSAEIMDKS